MKSVLVVLIALAATSLLNRVMPVAPSPSGGVASGRGATPIPVSANVGWLQNGSDGTYDLFLTRIDQVCPSDDGSACQPVQDTARGSIALGARPRSVSLSPDAAHLVVISSAAASGGSVVVVTVPTPRPSAGSSGTTATPAGGGTPATTARTSPGSSLTGSPLPSVLASTVPGSSAGPTAEPARISIAEGVVVVGGTAAYSPDGTWFAFSARPADGSAGPDIYLWRVGDAKARLVTGDHRSIFSAWLGDRILGSRVDEPGRPVRSAGPTVSAAPRSGPPAAPSTPSTSAPAIAPAAGESPGASTGTTQTASPVSPSPSSSPASPSPSLRAGGGSTGSPAPGRTTVPSSSLAPASPAASPPIRGATSFLLDPATGSIDEIDGKWWRPVVDPTGRWVVYWDGTLAADASGVDWQPATGRIVVAPWDGPFVGSGASSAAGTAAPSASFGGSASSAPAPIGNPAGTGRPQRSPGPRGLVDGPLVDFDAQFDPTGRLLVIWVADPAEPASGRLTLYAIDEATGAVAPAHAPLVALPALRGFSIGAGRLAWVSPPASGGAGSRIEIIGWTSNGFGTVESMPAESLLVVR